MSVVELSPRDDTGAPDRTPPQDIAAEQCVIGGMLLSKDAIADVVETLRGGDFYRPAHQTIYETILDLYGRGEPADADHGVRRARPSAASSAALVALRTCTRSISSVPTAANAGYYARIVRERAVLRRLVEAGTRIAQMGYADDRRGRRCRRPRPGRDLRRHRAAHQRGLPPARRDHGGHARRDRGDRVPRRHDGRRSHRVHRPRRAHQRPAPRADDRRRGTSRSRQVDAGARPRALGVHQARAHQRHLLAWR